MNSVLRPASSRETAEDRHAEQQHADADDHRRLHEADEDVGHDLAEHDLDRRDRHGQQVLHGAALDLARDRERGEDQHGHGEDGADQPRHDVELGLRRPGCSGHATRISNGSVGADREWRGRARARSAPAWPSAPSAEPEATGSVASAIDQHRRLVAAPHAALEIGRDFDAEQHLAGRQQFVRARLRVRGSCGDLEIAGVLERGQDRAADDRCAPAAAPRSADGADWC